MTTRKVLFVLSQESDSSFSQALERKNALDDDWRIVDILREERMVDGVKVPHGVIVLSPKI